MRSRSVTPHGELDSWSCVTSHIGFLLGLKLLHHVHHRWRNTGVVQIVYRVYIARIWFKNRPYSVRSSIRLCIRLSVHMTIQLFVHLSMCRFVSPFMRAFVHPSIHPSSRASVHLLVLCSNRCLEPFTLWVCSHFLSTFSSHCACMIVSFSSFLYAVGFALFVTKILAGSQHLLFFCLSTFYFLNEWKQLCLFVQDGSTQTCPVHHYDATQWIPLHLFHRLRMS